MTVLTAFSVGPVLAAAPLAGDKTTRVSVGAEQANSNAACAGISSNGRYVLFESSANNLVPGDLNSLSDIFVRDRKTGMTTRVSVSSAGLEANGGCFRPVISSNGRFVAFRSNATNLVPGDGNASSDIFVHDQKTGKTTRASVDSAGLEGNRDSLAPTISSNGRYVAFQSDANNLVPGDTNNLGDIFVHDRKRGRTTLVSIDQAGSLANNGSRFPAISSNGRYVAFESFASDLVSGDGNGLLDIFVRDRKTGKTTRASVDSAGLEGNGESLDASVSSNGRFVAFQSDASNLVPGDGNGQSDVFVHDRKTGRTTRVSVDSAGLEGSDSSTKSSISSNGRYVAFQSDASDLVVGDVNSETDIFVHDRKRGRTTRVSVSSAGLEANGFSIQAQISANGRIVAFISSAQNLSLDDDPLWFDCFVHERKTGVTSMTSLSSRGSQANAQSTVAAISSNGRYVAFQSLATNLVPRDENALGDVFVLNRKTRATARVSVDSAGREGNGLSFGPAISAHGRIVAFQSLATNLVPGDGNAAIDVFVRDRKTGLTTRVSVNSAGQQGNNMSLGPSVSSSGRYIAFQSLASNLVAGDGNASSDAFVRDRKTGLTERLSLDSAGVEGNGTSGNPAISSNGRYVAFESDASNLVPADGNGVSDIFVRDRKIGTTTRVSVDSGGLEANGSSSGLAISANGRYVTFGSGASNLVPADGNGVPDIFVHDRKTGTTTRISISSAGLAGNNTSRSPSISRNGRFVAFQSDAGNLVPGDGNGSADIFVHDRRRGKTVRASVGATGAEANGASSDTAISSNGRYVAFQSGASNLVPGDGNGSIDCFVRDRK